MRLLRAMFLFCWMLATAVVCAAPPEFAAVKPNVPLSFPTDYGAHPDFKTEWWYATGWLQTPDKKPLGFQITFFRSATEHDRANPSAFAPSQLIIGHAALSDPALGKLQHDQRSARAGFGIAYAKQGDTDIKLDDWRLLRNADGSYRAVINARDFTLELTMTPDKLEPAPMLQGERGFSRKGPLATQASYYYSQPQLQVSGSVTRNGARVNLQGSAWLDHEWSTSVLDADATGWDWLGANLDDGGALMAFQIRRKGGGVLWAHAALRERGGKITQFATEQVHFAPARFWRSPRTNATYPVATTITAGTTRWTLIPLQDDQELDSRQSTGSVYWEGGVTILRDDQPAGRGYLELTGYLTPLKL